jgi:hypothetical protein
VPLLPFAINLVVVATAWFALPVGGGATDILDRATRLPMHQPIAADGASASGMQSALISGRPTNAIGETRDESLA